jgi:hypothetical protein
MLFTPINKLLKKKKKTLDRIFGAATTPGRWLVLLVCSPKAAIEIKLCSPKAAIEIKLNAELRASDYLATPSLSRVLF